MVSAGARAYNGSLGAEPPPGSRGRAPGGGSGGRPPEAESPSAFRCRVEVAELPHSAYFAESVLQCKR